MLFRPRFTLFVKIQLWFFLNLIILSVVLLTFFNLQFRLDPTAPLSGQAPNRIETVGELISQEVKGLTHEERSRVLQRYSQAYRVEFYLFTNDGNQLAGETVTLPSEVMNHLKRGEPGGPRQPPGNPPPSEIWQPDPPPDPPPPGPPPPLKHPIFKVKTFNPTRYWVGVRIPVLEKEDLPLLRSTLIAVSDSMSGNGLFFDPIPWFMILLIIISLSILFWLPLIRSITKAIAEMTKATEQIAEGNFEVRISEKRTDEIGRLGKAINHLGFRLSGFLKGQKRFLGDISHELCSPLARIQVALGILEQRVDSKHLSYVEDLQEEVRYMSNLVNELLSFSKAGIKPAEIKLERIPLFNLVKQVVEREARQGDTITVSIGEDLMILAHPELLSRALANVIRNAIRYAGSTGPITISAERDGTSICLSVSDCGPGVPEAEIEKLFDPFYRLEPDRARNTGGAGLGLAIVKTCVESCHGTVSARNLKPSGLEIRMIFPATA